MLFGVNLTRVSISIGRRVHEPLQALLHDTS
jgi:hypothetical protein